jgi:hypothetical protein
MYLTGDGSVKKPWRFPCDFPSDALHWATTEKLIEFIREEKWFTTWSFCDKLIYYTLWLVAPYAKSWYHRQVRLKHFKNLSIKLKQAFRDDFWKDKALKTIRLSCDSQVSSVYVDFIDPAMT